MTKSSFLFFATTALLLGTLLFGRTVARRIPEELAQPLSTISAEIAGWTVTEDRRLDARVLDRLIPTSYLSRSYRKQNDQMDLFIAYYAQQRSGESMHSPKHCLPGGGWEIWRYDSADVKLNGRIERINKYSIENNGTRMLMFYWYQSGARVVASEYTGKLLLARDTLLTGRTAGSIVRISLPDNPAAHEEGLAIAAAVIPQVERVFARR